MKKKRLIVITSMVIIFAIGIFIYTKQEDQGQQQQAESFEEGIVDKISLPEEIIDDDESNIEDDNGIDDGLVADEEDIVVEDEDLVSDNEDIVIEDGDGSGTYGEPAAKLPKEYEDAMANSDLAPFEKEMIRLIVEKEGKTFAEALESVRPGSTVEEAPSQPTKPTEKPATGKPSTEKPTKPAKPNPPKTEKPKDNGPGDANYNNDYKPTDEQKKADEDALNDWDNGSGGKGGNVDHEPDL